MTPKVGILAPAPTGPTSVTGPTSGPTVTPTEPASAIRVLAAVFSTIRWTRTMLALGAGSVDEKLAYVDRIYARARDLRYPIWDNLKNVARNLIGRPRSGKVAILVLPSPFYDWVVPLRVIQGWMAATGFTQVRLLNEHEPDRC